MRREAFASLFYHRELIDHGLGSRLNPAAAQRRYRLEFQIKTGFTDKAIGSMLCQPRL
jgi:hypothetical protein